MGPEVFLSTGKDLRDLLVVLKIPRSDCCEYLRVFFRVDGQLGRTLEGIGIANVFHRIKDILLVMHRAGAVEMGKKDIILHRRSHVLANDVRLT